MLTDLAEVLAPQRESAIEWWFVHGFFGDKSEPSHAFMTSFFRHRIHTQVTGPMGNSLLISVLNLKTGEYSFSSRVNPALIEYFLRSRETAGKINVDQEYIDILMDEIRTHGPLRGIRQDDSPVILDGGSFHIGWRNFILGRNKSGIELEFVDPETAVPIQLKLKPACGMMVLNTDGNSQHMGMDVYYRSCPRLSLSGAIGNQRVSGEAWLDHQWGDHVLHRTIGSKRQTIGWDWFGLHLDDGSNWLFMVLRNASSRRIIARFLSVQQPDGFIHHSSRFRIKPLRNWESSHTRIKYPIQWRLEAPELKAEFTFTPYREDQEIPVFGGMRAVWEGAGKISGTLSGTEIQGRARGEFQGYGYIFDFDQFWKSAAARVDHRVREFFPNRLTTSSFRNELGHATRGRNTAVLTEMIADPVWDLLARGGKRWRPIFTICLLDALGLDPGPFETMVCALAELTHAGAMIVDDIEDSSLIRRGRPCTYLSYGVGPSINAANTIYFLSTLPVFEHPSLTETQKLEIHRLIMTYHVRAHFGQAQDLHWSKDMSDSNLNKWLKCPITSQILQMYEDKTAGPVMGLAETAAIIARSSHKVRQACRAFARGLGTAFQIVDDIHDFAQTPGWTKKRGGDLTEGKLTYVIIRALEELDKKRRTRLTELLCQRYPKLSDDAVLEGIHLVKQSGALTTCAEEARKIFWNSWNRLSCLLPPSESKIMLATLCSRLIEIDLGDDS